jgi:hypothetical protein
VNAPPAPGQAVKPPPARNGVALASAVKRRGLSTLLAAETPQGDSISLIGPPKIGKTSAFCFGAPAPVFIFTDRMGDAVLPPSFRDKIKPEAWDETPGSRESRVTVLGSLRALRDEEHGYQTVVIDTINRAQLLLWHWLRERYKVASVEDIGGGYGKGFTAALEQIDEMLSILFQLAERGITWIIVSHQEAKTGNNPAGEEYEKWVLQLNQKAAGAILGAVNTILFASPGEVITGKKKQGDKMVNRGHRGIVTKAIVAPRPGIDAGSRWLLPPEFMLSWAVYEQEKATGQRLREELARHLATLDTAARAEADTFLGQHGGSRAAVEQVIAGLRTLAPATTDTNTDTDDTNDNTDKE